MKNMLLKYGVFVLFALLFLPSTAQQSINVFFAGNSYTAANDLPQMVANIAQSMGDEMVYTTNTPGGCTFEMHCTNATMNKICRGGWDFVVLQEQSQLPAFPIEMVEEMVFPFAAQLVDSIYTYNPDGEAMFFMTWGRKNGDTEYGNEYPMMSTYEGMDSLLYARYMYMGEANDASVCPVGRVWHHLRDNYNRIELYTPDQSHPSLAGSYAAACAFYTMLFGRDPDSITYDAGLGMKVANIIRQATHEVVFDSLWKWKRPVPEALQSVSAPASIKLWPNPSSGHITVEVNEPTFMEVLDVQGRCIAKYPLQSGANPIDLGKASAGLYFIKLGTGEVRKVFLRR